jgi:hypothetical protein
VVLLAGYVIGEVARPAQRSLVDDRHLVVAYYFWWGVANAVDFGLPVARALRHHYLALGPLAVLAAGTRCWPAPAQSSPVSRSSAWWSVPSLATALQRRRCATRARGRTGADGLRTARAGAPGSAVPARSVCVQRRNDPISTVRAPSASTSWAVA